MIVRTTPAVTYQPPCTMRGGLGCTGQCNQCPAARSAGMGNVGAFYDSFPAPLNNPLVLVAIVAVVLILFGGGLSFFGRRKKSGSARRNRLNLIRARADYERARELAA